MPKKKVTLFVVRHGKTMFNTLTRVQGWSDTPLTKEGERVVDFLAEGLKQIPFVSAYSSDSGRAIQTARMILAKHLGEAIPFSTDERIREWCFGSLEGGYDGELWGVVPRVLNFKNYDEMMKDGLTYEILAQALMDVDTADWAEPYIKIKDRIWNGFRDKAEKAAENGGGNVLIVSHGMTISNLLNLIDPSLPMQQGLVNASVSKLEYANGKFEILSINDVSYIENGENLTHKII